MITGLAETINTVETSIQSYDRRATTAATITNKTVTTSTTDDNTK